MWTDRQADKKKLIVTFCDPENTTYQLKICFWKPQKCMTLRYSSSGQRLEAYCHVLHLPLIF
jgi:hypothetical protein